MTTSPTQPSPDRANPWMTTLWFVFIVLVVGGAIALGAASTASGMAGAAVLAGFGTAMLTAGFMALVLGVVVAAVRWKP